MVRHRDKDFLNIFGICLLQTQLYSLENKYIHEKYIRTLKDYCKIKKENKTFGLLTFREKDVIFGIPLHGVGANLLELKRQVPL